MLRTLLKIRMSTIGILLLLFYIVFVFLNHRVKLTPGQLALFSVNSFLFGYYFAPLLSAQKSRVASLIASARQEEMAILDLLTQSHLVSSANRHKLKVKLRVYLDDIIGNTNITADNQYYDELLFFSKRVKGEDVGVMNLIYDRLAKTLVNRDAMNNLFGSKIYSHEWMVVTVLFFITLFFSLQTDFAESYFFGLMLAVLCTGLTMLMVILLKFSTLTHKEARRMWQPLIELRDRHFDDINPEEAAAEKARINAQPSAA